MLAKFKPHAGFEPCSRILGEMSLEPYVAPDGTPSLSHTGCKLESLRGLNHGELFATESMLQYCKNISIYITTLTSYVVQHYPVRPISTLPPARPAERGPLGVAQSIQGIGNAYNTNTKQNNSN